MSKVLDQFSAKHGEIIEVQIVNVREYPDVARLYQVRYVPTLVFLDEEGKMLDKRVGTCPWTPWKNNGPIWDTIFPGKGNKSRP